MLRPEQDRRNRKTAGRGQYEAAVEASTMYDFPAAFWLMLDENGLVLDVSPQGLRVLGPRRSLRNTPLSMWVGEDHRASIREHVRRYRASADAIETDLELNGRGGLLAVRLCSRRVRMGDRVLVPSVVIDISDWSGLEEARETAERRRAVAERERAQARAAELAKDRLFAMVSHELRNPLSPALLAATHLAEMPDLPESARKAADIIRRNVELEARLIEDLLDVARVTRGQLELRRKDVDVHDVLQQAVEASAGDARAKSIDVDVVLHARAHHAHADPARLQQVFWNLLTNAVKFTDPGGRVAVRTSSEESGLMFVAIRDTGMGMDDDTIERLFRPFEQPRTSSARFGGLGLGLTIAQGIVEAHGGCIWAASEGRDTGSTFEVQLPAHDGHGGTSVPAGETASRSPEAAGRRGRILVVEDNDDTSSLLALYLEPQGYEVTVARSLEEGLAALDQHWDAVLSDIGLGDGSGLEIARRAERDGRRPVLLAISGYGEQRDVEASREAGFEAHLVKPVDLEKLLTLLRQRPDVPETGAAGT